MAFKFLKQSISDVVLIEPKTYFDKRGYFQENYKISDFKSNGIMDDFVQDNLSFSCKNTLRGLHFQIEPYAQSKLVSCLQGKILDIVVDLRMNSDTFGHYLKFELSSYNKNILYVPKGFAHGFLALEDSLVLYKTNSEYNEKSQCGIKFNDSSLNIDWGIDFEPILSQKDNELPLLSQLSSKELFN